MKCVICKQGETQSGHATVMLERDETIIVFKGVPAEVCENCGEYYLDEQTTERLLDSAEKTIQEGAEIEVLKYAA